MVEGYRVGKDRLERSAERYVRGGRSCSLRLQATESSPSKPSGRPPGAVKARYVSPAALYGLDFMGRRRRPRPLPHVAFRLAFMGAGLANFASSIGTLVLMSFSTMESRPSSHA